MNKDTKYKRSIEITEEELNAVEDIFFCEVSEEEHKRIHPLLANVWEQLCPSQDEEKALRSREQVNNKIIWTKRELEDWHAKHPLKEFPPLALISASTLQETKVEEQSSVQGTISNIVVRFPPRGSPGGGAAGLVSVSVSLNDKRLIPWLLRLLPPQPLVGDNREDSFLFATPITKGDIVEVIVKNDDELWDHSIGVRVLVDKGKRGE